MSDSQTVFKSPEGRTAIRAYYNQILSLFPVTQRTLSTSCGDTFVLEAGAASQPPLLLLHDSCSNSAAWLGDIAALTARHRVLAVDIPGEPGNSADRRLDFHSDAYTRWLLEVLDTLELDQAVLAGNSMGGFLALRFAAAYPRRVSSLILLAPSGLVPPSPAFLAQTANFAADPASAKASAASVTGAAALPQEVLQFMTLVAEHFIPFTGALPTLSDEQLQRLTMPVLMIAATGDVTMDSAQAARRLTALAPQAQVQLRPGAHVITGAAPEILTFLEKER